MTEEVPDSPPADNAAAPQDIPTSSDVVSPTKSMLEDAGGDDKPAPAAPADWPEDWRSKLASGDEKLQKRLERFASPADVWKSFRALEQKVSSGELKKPLSKDATPEELKVWREENGIPETPEGYDLNLDNGLVIGEEDKLLVNEFLKEMHSVNATPEIVKSAISAYYRIVEAEKREIEERDSEERGKTEDALHAEWGGDYKRNLNIIDALLTANASDSVREALYSARTPDGLSLGNNADVLRFLANIAREINPAATIVPNSVNNSASAIEDEIKALEKQMGDRDSDYWKEPKIQERYRQLITAQDKIRSRS